MTERPEPDQVLEHGQVTLRRWREDDLDAGTGVGVVWRLTRPVA